MDELPVGEAENPKTQPLKMGVSSAVALEGGAVSVVSPRVGLDHHSLVVPEEVHFVLADARVHLRAGQAVTATEAEEEAFELAAAEFFLSLEIGRADQPEVQSPPDGPLENPLGRGAVKVAKRPLGPRDRNAVAAGPNTGNEGVGSMDLDAAALSASAVPDDAYMDRSGMRLEHAPKRGGALMADDGSLAERENRRHAPAFEGQAGVADRVHTTMNAMKPAGLDSAGDSVLVDPGTSKLRCAHDAVLPSGNLRDYLVGPGAFLAHIASKAPTPVPLPFIARF